MHPRSGKVCPHMLISQVPHIDLFLQCYCALCCFAALPHLLSTAALCFSEDACPLLSNLAERFASASGLSAQLFWLSDEGSKCRASKEGSKCE